MGNENEKNEQNPGQQQNNPGNHVEPNRKNPSQSGENVYNPQDPTVKKPGQDTGRADRSGRERSEEVEKRRILTGITESGHKPRQTAVAFPLVPPFCRGRARTQSVETAEGCHAILFSYFICLVS